MHFQYPRAAESKLVRCTRGAYVHDGFWACMDTFKEKQMLDEIHESGLAPWQVWRNDADPRPRGTSWL